MELNKHLTHLYDYLADSSLIKVLSTLPLLANNLVHSHSNQLYSCLLIFRIRFKGSLEELKGTLALTAFANKNPKVHTEVAVVHHIDFSGSAVASKFLRGFEERESFIEFSHL